MARIERTVFISYRRKDISWALAVYQYLTSQKYDVFFDYTSLSGGDFEQVIISNIKARAHFVLILTPSALDRCDEPDDWLRREIETAIEEKRNVIPLLFDGFSFSAPSTVERLTGKLKPIKRYNGLDVPVGYFLEAMERLRTRYLNMPLDAVLHPVSPQVQKVVKEEQQAANRAILLERDADDQGQSEERGQDKVNVKPFNRTHGSTPPVGVDGPIRAKSKSNSLYLGIGMVFSLVLLCGMIVVGFVLQSMFSNNTSTQTPRPTKIVTTSTKVDLKDTNTPTMLPASTSTLEPTLTLTPTPAQSPTLTSFVPPFVSDITSTTWLISYVLPQGGARKYNIVFQPGGILDNSASGDVTKDDAWSQDGAEVVITLNDKFVTYTGEISDNIMTGTALNVNGITWTWTAELVSPVDITSTTWVIIYTLPGSGEKNHKIIFHPGGVLENFDPADTTENDTWSQDGAKVTMIINDGFVTYTGEISGNKMSGTATNVNNLSWSWSAELSP